MCLRGIEHLNLTVWFVELNQYYHSCLDQILYIKLPLFFLGVMNFLEYCADGR